MQLLSFKVIEEASDEFEGWWVGENCYVNKFNLWGSYDAEQSIAIYTQDKEQAKPIIDQVFDLAIEPDKIGGCFLYKSTD